MIDLRQNLINIYLTRVNDYLTIEKMAEHHNIDNTHLQSLIDMGKFYYENPDYLWDDHN